LDVRLRHQVTGTSKQGRPQHESRRPTPHQDSEGEVPARCQIHLQTDVRERPPVKNPHCEYVCENSGEVESDSSCYDGAEHLQRGIHSESADNHQGNKERYPDDHTKPRILDFRLGNGWIAVSHRNSRELAYRKRAAYTYTVLQ